MSDLSPQSGPKRTMFRVAVTNRDFMSTRPSQAQVREPRCSSASDATLKLGYFERSDMCRDQSHYLAGLARRQGAGGAGCQDRR
jgi:hypothetical protein